MINFRNEFMPLNITGEVFQIRRNGDIYSGLKEIDLNVFKETTGLKYATKEILTLVAFRNVGVPPSYWNKIKTGRTLDIDSPEHLFMNFVEPIESLEYPGFFLIPYYSSYLINQRGEVFNLLERRMVQPSLTSNGYFTLRLRSDGGKTSNMLRHRILLMTFKPNVGNYSDLVVNHINGQYGDDRLENLEWCTNSENLTKSSLSGQNEDLKRFGGLRIEVRDTNAGITIGFKDTYEASKYFNFKPRVVVRRAKTEGKLSFNGLQFRFFNKDANWPIPKEVGSGGNYKELNHIKLVFEDGTVKFCGTKEAARIIGITRQSLQRMLRNGLNKSKNGFEVYRVGSGRSISSCTNPERQGQCYNKRLKGL